MKLYCAPGTISVAAIIAAAEAGVALDLQRVDFGAAEQTKTPYLEVNPKGRVPTLETERGRLTETGAILEYLSPDLVPSDHWQAAQMRSVMYWLASTMHVNHAHKMRGTRWASKPESHADMAANVERTMTESCRFVEEHALREPWVLGGAFSLADIYLFMVTSWAPGDGVTLSDFPKLAAHFAAMQERGSVRAAMQDGWLPHVKP